MLDILDNFGFVEPVRGKKYNDKECKVKLNKNFYPDEENNKEINTK